MSLLSHPVQVTNHKYNSKTFLKQQFFLDRVQSLYATFFCYHTVHGLFADLWESYCGFELVNGCVGTRPAWPDSGAGPPTSGRATEPADGQNELTAVIPRRRRTAAQHFDRDYHVVR